MRKDDEDDIINLREADGIFRLLKMLEEWERPVFPIGGKDVLALGVPEGPLVGKMLKALEGEWVDSDFSLTREELLERLKESV